MLTVSVSYSSGGSVGGGGGGGYGDHGLGLAKHGGVEVVARVMACGGEGSKSEGVRW